MSEDIGQGLVNYETGDVSQWDSSTIDSGNTFTATVEAALHGVYGGRVYFGGTSNNAYFAKAPSGGNQTTLCLRKYFRIDTNVAPAIIGYIQPLKILQGSTTLAQINFRISTGGVVDLYSLQYQNGAGLSTLSLVGYALTFSEDTDYYIELLWDYNAGSNNIYVRVDGVAKGTVEGVSQTTYQYANVGLGGWLHSSGGKFGNGTIIFEDDFKIDTNWIGAYSDASSPSITSISNDTLYDGQTGVVITGTDFSASGNIVHLNTAADGSGTDVEQTITEEDEDEITFTVDKGSIPIGTAAYIIVENDSEVLSNGEAVLIVSLPVFPTVDISEDGCEYDSDTGIISKEYAFGSEYTGRTVYVREGGAGSFPDTLAVILWADIDNIMIGVGLGDSTDVDVDILDATGAGSGISRSRQLMG